MKKAFIILLLVSAIHSINAQSVGIGTNTPNNTAELDIVSTTRGLLLPRMTSAQRSAIPSPAGGLMVYDTDRKSLYQFDGSIWRTILNNDYWNRINAASNYVINLQDSIGIAVVTPKERLDVSGNIRSRRNIFVDSSVTVAGRIDADGVIAGGGISSSGALYVSQTSLLQGAVTGSSTGTFYGTITSNAGMTINNASATLSLKASGDDKGFVQLSGDDLRLGTYSTNTLGKFIVRTGGTNNLIVDSDGNTGVGIEAPVAKLHINSGSSNTTLRLQADGAPSLQFYSGTTSIGSIQPSGSNLRIIAPGDYVSIGDVLYADDASNRVGIGTTAPEEKLHVVGKLKVSGTGMNIDDGRVTGTNTGAANNLLPVCYGTITELGGVQNGTSNFTARRLSTGTYEISCSQITTSSVVMINVNAGGLIRCSGIARTEAGKIFVSIFDDSDDHLSIHFQFVAFNP